MTVSLEFHPRPEDIDVLRAAITRLGADHVALQLAPFDHRARVARGLLIDEILEFLAARRDQAELEHRPTVAGPHPEPEQGRLQRPSPTFESGGAP